MHPIFIRLGVFLPVIFYEKKVEMHPNFVLLGAVLKKIIINKCILQLTDPNIHKFHFRKTQHFLFFGLKYQQLTASYIFC